MERQEKEEEKKAPAEQFLWFSLVMISGIGYVLNLIYGFAGFAFEMTVLVVMVFSLYRATRAWVRHNPPKPRDNDDVMI